MLGGPLCEFSRPFGQQVKPKRVHPKETGFVYRLYELRGLPEDKAQQIEQLFMKPVDNAASDALECFYSDRPRPLTARERTGWTGFILSLLLRTPEEVEAFKQGFQTDWHLTTPALERRYRKARRSGDPATFTQFLKNTDVEYVERAAMRVLARLMLHNKEIATHVNSMHWGTVELPFDASPLMTSDRPVIRHKGLVHDDAFILMPIGPKHFFYAANTRPTEIMLRSTDAYDIVAWINETVVSHAHRYVYAVNDTPLQFVQKHMSSSPAPLVSSRLINGREPTRETRNIEKGKNRLLSKQ
jgi:hypothetical protein